MCWSPDRQGPRSATLSAKCPTHARCWRTQVSHTSPGGSPSLRISARSLPPECPRAKNHLASGWLHANHVRAPVAMGSHVEAGRRRPPSDLGTF